MIANEREMLRDIGSLKRSYARDLTEACRLLYAAGADEEEVDTILGEYVPANVDADWAERRRSWYALHVEGL